MPDSFLTSPVVDGIVVSSDAKNNPYMLRTEKENDCNASNMSGSVMSSSHRITSPPKNPHNLPPPPSVDHSPSSFHSRKRVLYKTNELINFCSRPFLLRSMRSRRKNSKNNGAVVSMRSQWCAALRVSRALNYRGVELVSMRGLLQYTDTDPNDDPNNDQLRKDETNGTTSTKTKQPTVDTNGNGGGSSIFDSFDMGPPKPKKKQVTAPEM
eukprot:CAMPEP_0194367336 /NCGR_PEP_ID=MMETSP0174-20130528/15403_1 /TAXON_ID=216777 /ORGANISM="Proboscia alata, Strain PI-D3" /LENGTH=210 /DNA_ID=CAMNT_0039143007 /DNA_START=36 /DNA_END=665 /DNA_ORIENTATION=-